MLIYPLGGMMTSQSSPLTWNGWKEEKFDWGEKVIRLEEAQDLLEFPLLHPRDLSLLSSQGRFSWPVWEIGDVNWPRKCFYISLEDIYPWPNLEIVSFENAMWFIFLIYGRFTLKFASIMLEQQIDCRVTNDHVVNRFPSCLRHYFSKSFPSWIVFGERKASRWTKITI